MNVDEILRRALNEKSCYIGTKRTLKALKKGEVKTVVVAKNCPKEFIEEVKKHNASVMVFNGNNFQLGEFCGKPFGVAMVGLK